MPPDSEIVAPVSIRSRREFSRGGALSPTLDITESYGVLVGHTVVDEFDWSDVVALPSFACDGDLVPVSAVQIGGSFCSGRSGG